MESRNYLHGAFPPFPGSKASFSACSKSTAGTTQTLWVLYSSKKQLLVRHSKGVWRICTLVKFQIGCRLKLRNNFPVCSCNSIPESSKQIFPAHFFIPKAAKNPLAAHIAMQIHQTCQNNTMHNTPQATTAQSCMTCIPAGLQQIFIAMFLPFYWLPKKTTPLCKGTGEGPHTLGSRHSFTMV